MFDRLIETLQNLSPEIKLLISAIVGLAAVALIVKPIIKGMSSIADGRWVPGIIWLLAALAVVAIGVGIIAVVYGLGEDVGTDMENELSMIQPYITSYLS